MLTLRMNKMLSMECLGKQELHTFHKPAEILEDSHTGDTAIDQTILDSALLSHQNVYSITEVSEENVGITEVSFFQDETNGATTSLLPLSLLSYDPRSLVSISAPCSSDLETVFSSSAKHNDPQQKSMNHSVTAADENTDFLHLILGDIDDGCSTSSQFQVWDVFGFYFSESISAVHFDGLMGFTNDNAFYHDCTSIVNMGERTMGLPSSDKTGDANNASNDTSIEHTVSNSDDTCLYLHTKPTDSENECTSASRGLVGSESVDQELLSSCLPDLMEIDSSNCSLRLAKLPERMKPTTLVLDLDETLVHSVLDQCDNADFTLQVFFNMKEHTVYVRQRPHLKMFLDKVAQMFELVIFTASQRIYAEQLIDKLDPDGKLISRRIYRESCIFSDGSYTKDLTILGVDLAKVAIIDNTPQVFQLQVDNGIPIKSWFDDPSDHELVELLPFLETIADAEDVRPIISKAFSHKDQQI